MEETTQLAQIDINDLSDEELSKLDLSQLNVPTEPEVAETQPSEQPLETPVDDAGHQVAPEEVQEIPEHLNTNNPVSAAPQADDQTADDNTLEQIQEQSPTSGDVDYKAFYEKVTASFKANGRDLAITDPEDVVAMMQRGAGFAKKMATLKPSMRILRTLENHKISEADLGYLIDLHNKNPEAISKLVKESGVDVYSIDAEKADGYKTQAAIATDGEVELDDVVRELTETSPTFQKTFDVVVNQWDDYSKQIAVQHPQVLKLLDSHMRLGYFDTVMGEVERLRAIGGHIDGLSDFDAYRKVGDEMNARGVFSQPNSGSTSATSQTTTLAAPGSVAQPQQRTELNAQRRAASSPRPTAKATPVELDYGSMTDDELMAALNTRR